MLSELLFQISPIRKFIRLEVLVFLTPINFDLPEEVTLIRETVREFAEKEISPMAEELDAKETFSPELTKKMGDLGLFGAYLPEEYGGSEMSYLAYIVAVEEIARVDGSQAATVATHNSLGIGPLYYFGTKEQKEKFEATFQSDNILEYKGKVILPV